MAIVTTVVGSYPKPPDEGQPFVLRQVLHRLERGEATVEDLRRAQDEATRAVIAEQEACGVDIVTDGQQRWDDIVTPFASRLAGFEIGGLLRFFDNNVYYRRPVCVGPVEWRGPMSVEDWRFAQSAASRPVKAVLPGPVTFARLSVDQHYGDHRTFVLALASVLAQEAFELEAAGARYIQLDEPALLSAPEDLDLAGEALGLIAGQLRSEETELTLATYFSGAKRLAAALFELPVRRFGLDFVSGRDNFELVGGMPAGVRLQAGVVDARNTMLEDVDELVRTISELADAVGPDNLWVSPSCGLEFLPREKARAKLQRLVEAARKVGG